MPLWIGSYLADTMKLTTVQHGAYFLLLMAYWRERCPLKDDDDELRSITKTERAEWRRMRPVLAAFFKVGDGVWWHKRVEQEMAEADERSRKAKEKAQKGADARWKDKDKSPPGDAPSMPQAKPEDKPDQCPPPSPPPSEQSSEKKKRKRSPPPDRPDEVSEQTWNDWMALRDRKSAPVTQTVLNEARSEAEKASLTLERFLCIWCVRGSQGLQAEWLKPHELSPGKQAEPAWRTEQRERTQKAAPGVAVGSAIQFFEGEVKNVTPIALG